MPASLTALVDLRSRLAEDLLAYLDALVDELAALPAYFPAHLRTQAGAALGFDTIRQVVRVIEDREAFEQWLHAEALVSEQARAAGREISQRAYAPRRARPERAEGEGERREAERPRPPPPPIPWDDAAAARFRHAVILADPGFGKTWLLKHEAIRLARQAAGQLRARRHGVEAIVVPIFVRLSELARSDDELEQALTRHVLGRVSAAWKRRAERQATGDDPASLPLRRPPTPTPGLGAYLASQLARGHCTVLIDAWDEVPPEPVGEGGVIRGLAGYRQRQGERLKAFAEGFTGPLRLSSRLVGYGGKLLPGAQELELIAFEPPQIEVFLGVWFPDGERRQALLTLFQEQHTLRGLSRIPLMLTLLCRAFQQEGALPERRVDLYESCLRGLLRDWLALDKQADREDPKLSDSYVEAMLDLLAGVAHALHCQGLEQFTEWEFSDAIRAMLRTLTRSDELEGRKPSDLIQELKRDGVLIRIGDDAPAYLFLHRTFQEYLAARELARQAKEPARYVEIIQDIAERLWWLPDWREVIVLLAGLVDDPVPLLKALAQKRGDDIARRRLGLAGLALGEIDAKRFRGNEALCRVRDEITTEAVEWWLQRQNGTEKLAQYVAGSFPALARREGRYYRKPLPHWITPDLRQWIGKRFPRYQGVTLLEWIAVGLSGRTANHYPALDLLSQVRVATPAFLEVLAKLLRDPDSNVRWSVAKAVGHLGVAAATPLILAALGELLRDPNSLVRLEAAKAVGELGAAAATPPILESLPEMLRDQSECSVDDWVTATLSISKLGPAAAMPLILAALSRLLLDSEKWVQYRHLAADDLGKLVAAATPSILESLPAALRNPKWEVRMGVAKAVGELGAAAATPPILAALAELLRDREEGGVRRAAAYCVGNLGTAAATAPFLEALVELLRDPEEDVRASAASAVGKLGPAAATPPILAALAELLRDQEGGVRSAAAYCVGGLGTAAAAPFLEALAELLRDPVEDVRHSAASAVGKLGPAAATPPILAALAELLRDPDRNVCWSAAEAVRRLGAAATPSILESLAAALRDPVEDVRYSAASAVGNLGPAAATPPILAALAELLRDPDRNVCWSAAEAVRRLGAAATPSILESLAAALRDREEGGVRRAAAYCVGNLGTAAATAPFLEALAELLRDPEEDVRASAAGAVDKLGPAAATPPILAALAELLRDQTWWIRRSAADAVAGLGAAAATAPILAALAGLLRAPDGDVRRSAAKAVGGLGAAAVTAPFSTTLAGLLRDPDGDVRRSAAKAVGGLGAAAATAPFSTTLAGLLRDPDWSVRYDAATLINALLEDGVRIPIK